jgi:tetratricopeptide (TPR) repeat protein
VAHARAVFEGALHTVPDHASAHVGLANALLMQFEMTRADRAPDRQALSRAAHHAREACRLDAAAGEAWATLAMVLERTGDAIDARASAKRAVTLEPDNWRHHFRLAYVSWGEERLGAAHRTLALLPGFPLAHWLAATVHVARQAMNEAERELTAALAVDGQRPGRSRFSAVALHWLLGLIHLARGDEAGADRAFAEELSSETAGHLYARECAANTWYAIGALRLRQDRQADASAAFARALERVPAHPMARVGLIAAGSLETLASPFGELPNTPTTTATPSIDAALGRAALLATKGAHADAARLVGDALDGAAAGSAGWLLPIEPLLHVTAHADIWARPLAQLRNRAA